MKPKELLDLLAGLTYDVRTIRALALPGRHLIDNLSERS